MYSNGTFRPRIFQNKGRRPLRSRFAVRIVSSSRWRACVRDLRATFLLLHKVAIDDAAEGLHVVCMMPRIIKDFLIIRGNEGAMPLDPDRARRRCTHATPVALLHYVTSLDLSLRLANMHDVAPRHFFLVFAVS
jgi:hypothetical protein